MPKNATTAGTKRRGRPPHVPTTANRRKVAIAAGGGMRHEDIAVALGISRPTLDLYYRQELSEGALGRRLEVLAALHKAAVTKGSSSAAKAYLEHQAELAAPPAPSGEKPEKPAAEAVKAPKLGKKEQAQADAATAAVGTEWGDLLPTSGSPLQ